MFLQLALSAVWSPPGFCAGSSSLLFTTYLNDVVNQIYPDSSINRFVDDIALYRTIRSPKDYIKLQDDITAESCSLAFKHLDLNASKCCFLLLSRKRTHSIHPPLLMLSGTPLERASSYKYLGVQITSDLMWSSHISNICNETRRLIGMMYHKTFFILHPPQFTYIHYPIPVGVCLYCPGLLPKNNSP